MGLKPCRELNGLWKIKIKKAELGKKFMYISECIYILVYTHSVNYNLKKNIQTYILHAYGNRFAKVKCKLKIWHPKYFECVVSSFVCIMRGTNSKYTA